jgi:hypothetical protein
MWDILGNNYVRNVGTDNSEYIKLYQQAGFQPTNTPVAQQDWHFRMSDLNSWYNMSQSWFEFNFQLLDESGTAADDTTRNLIYPSDMRCLFKNVQLDLNSVTVEANNQNAFMYYNIDRAFMSQQYISTVGSLGGMNLTDVKWDNPSFLAAEASFAHALSDFSTGTPEAYNGDKARLQTYAKKAILCTIPTGSNPSLSSVCTLRVPMCDIFNFFRYWTRCHKGLDVQARFTTVGDAPFITNRTRDGVGGADPRTGNYKLQWAGSGITWWVRSLKPSPRVESQLNAVLSKGAEVFCPFLTPKVYNFQPLAGNQSYRIVNESSRPMFMYVAFQRKTVQTSTDDISVLQLPAGLTSFTAFVNGKKVPNLDMKIGAPEPPPHQGFPTTGTAALPSDIDYTELYHRYLLLTQSCNAAYKHNYSNGSGAHDYINWCAVSPFVSFDLIGNAIGDISGSNSEIVLNYNHAAVDGATAITDYNMYAVILTERVVSLSLSESSSYIAIR